jgi:hypothetical protein
MTSVSFRKVCTILQNAPFRRDAHWASAGFAPFYLNAPFVGTRLAVSEVKHKTFDLQMKFCEDTLSSRLCRATSPQGEACFNSYESNVKDTASRVPTKWLVKIAFILIKGFIYIYGRPMVVPTG